MLSALVSAQEASAPCWPYRHSSQCVANQVSHRDLGHWHAILDSQGGLETSRD